MNRFSIKGWTRGFPLALVLGLALGLAACGGGGGSGTSAGASGSGRVALLVTDGPTADFDRINVRLDAVELLGSAGAVRIYAPQGGELVDLLALRGEAQLLTLSEEVPAGSYDKIRLQVASVELVKLAADGSILERHLADVPANGRIDLNPRGAFEVAAGGTLTIQLDLDANKAIHLVQAGQSRKYRFRPVIFVAIGEPSLPPQGKLVRLDGVVREPTADGFQLCPQPIASEEAAGRCIAVRVLPETVFFDALGAPVPFAELQTEDPAQVIGRFGSSDFAAPEGPVSAEFAAYVVELGDFLTLRGTMVSAPEVLGEQLVFTVEPSPGQGVTGVLQVQAEGSRIFSDDGSELEPTDLALGDLVQLDGVLALGSEIDLLRTALIIRETALVETSLEGVLLGPVAPDGPLSIDVLGVARCVRTTAETDAYLLSAGALRPLALSQLAPGAQVLVFGREDGLGCLVAEDLFLKE